jgi:hypothetical protein
MQEIINALPSVGPFLEKGGIIGVLVAVGMVLGLEVRRLRAELVRVYNDLNCQRMIASRYKTHLDIAGKVVDIGDIVQQFPHMKD